MKVLVVHSGNKVSGTAQYTFVNEQVAALRALGTEVFTYPVVGKGVRGYLSNLKSLCAVIKLHNIDVVHAHYGMCGLLCCLQHLVPVVVTYHGSDINVPSQKRFSQWAVWLAAYNIFVSVKLSDMVSGKRRFSIIPCGIDLSDLQTLPQDEARNRLHLERNKRYILFAGAFDNAVKDYPLAHKAFELMKDNDSLQLIELKGYTRDEVNLLLCSADVLLMTSKTEGSPQVIKEALACGCPIVSTDVGDVRERTANLEGTYVASSRKPEEIATLLSLALEFGKRTAGRQRIIDAGISNELIARKLIDIYKTCLE